MTDPSSAEPAGYNAALTELETILDSLDGDQIDIDRGYMRYHTGE